MGPFRALASLLVLHLLQGSHASLVQLKDNGYEDVIIAIDPGVPEDGEIIEQLKAMVTAASTYLFEATEKRFFFKSVSILIPETWARISGTNSVYACQGGSCVTRRCRIDSTTKLYEKGCQFFPDKVQTEKASIMFMQSIDSVVEFCNEKNHNQEAPSLQNKMCNFRSTWEVIRESEDYKNTTVMEETPPAPTFSLLRIHERIVCLVLDKSGSMSGSDRLNRMNQAAKHFLLETVENGSWVGMVQFDSVASIRSELIQIKSNSERDTLVTSLPTQALGGTSICSGIKKAFEVIEKAGFQLNGSEIVLLTDGEDSTAKACIGEVTESGVIIHLIALGPSADQALPQFSLFHFQLHSADAFKDDGVYSRYFTAYSENGRYSLKVRAHAGTNSARRRLGHPRSRAAYIPGWVVNGEIEGNPPRPETDENAETVVESFSRTASGGAFVVSGFTSSATDVFPPSQITDLNATPEGEEITLTWTAPGEDFDVGKVQQYIVRISGSMLDLRDSFEDALQVNTTGLSPKEANSKESFTFKPGSIPEENTTHIFIAIQSVDKSNLTSKVSNIAQVALFIPQADPSPDESQPNTSPDKNSSGVNVFTVVLSVIVSVVVISIIVSTIVCVIKKKNSSNRPGTRL
ncbi:calcium-activated chloride channel regulator 4-like [Octodon degus]|uniref:Calcium-activated chloride channel regulator 4-like n=1 Tax=Octodon degus TaxID=10160 RepID=A0A6P3FGQ9_OCTDE|nr:calcium-activated chloride channel regulator 4-like [Octodon degus]